MLFGTGSRPAGGGIPSIRTARGTRGSAALRRGAGGGPGDPGGDGPGDGGPGDPGGDGPGDAGGDGPGDAGGDGPGDGGGDGTAAPPPQLIFCMCLNNMRETRRQR